MFCIVIIYTKLKEQQLTSIVLYSWEYFDMMLNFQIPIESERQKIKTDKRMCISRQGATDLSNLYSHYCKEAKIFAGMEKRVRHSFSQQGSPKLNGKGLKTKPKQQNKKFCNYLKGEVTFCQLTLGRDFPISTFHGTSFSEATGMANLATLKYLMNIAPACLLDFSCNARKTSFTACENYFLGKAGNCR